MIIVNKLTKMHIYYFCLSRTTTSLLFIPRFCLKALVCKLFEMNVF